jgi:hypothetical protein
MEPQPNSSAPGATPRSRFAQDATPEAFGTSTGGAPAPGNGHGTAAPSPSEALKDASQRVAEIKEYASYLVAAKLDGLKLTLRNIVLYAALGLVGAVIGATVLVTASVYLLSGLAGAIGAIFPDRYGWWLGRVLVIGGAVAGVMFLMKSLTGSSRKRTIEKYENRKRVERNLYGHDVEERAREQARQAGAAQAR